MSKTFGAGIRQETKAKFDALLKSALRTKDAKTKSKQNLVENPSSSDEEIISYKDDAKSKHNDSSSSDEEISYNKNTPESDEKPVKKRSFFQMKIVNELKKNKLFKSKQTQEKKRAAGSKANLVSSDDDDDTKSKQNNSQDDVSSMSDDENVRKETERPTPKPRGTIATVKVTNVNNKVNQVIKSKLTNEQNDKIESSNSDQELDSNSQLFHSKTNKNMYPKNSYSDYSDEVKDVVITKNKKAHGNYFQNDTEVELPKARRRNIQSGIEMESKRDDTKTNKFYGKQINKFHKDTENSDNNKVSTRLKKIESAARNVDQLKSYVGESSRMNKNGNKSKSATQKSNNEPIFFSTQSKNRSKSAQFYKNDDYDDKNLKLKKSKGNSYKNNKTPSISDSSESNLNLQFKRNASNGNTFENVVGTNEKSRPNSSVIRKTDDSKESVTSDDVINENLKISKSTKVETFHQTSSDDDSDDKTLSKSNKLQVESPSNVGKNTIKQFDLKLKKLKSSSDVKPKRNVSELDKIESTQVGKNSFKQSDSKQNKAESSSKVKTFGNTSTKQIDSELTSTSVPSSGDEEIVEVHTSSDLSVENKSYIMEKFLKDSSQKDRVELKHPVPKPRQSRSNSTQSNGTFVSSPPKAKQRRNRRDHEKIGMDDFDNETKSYKKTEGRKQMHQLSEIDVENEIVTRKKGLAGSYNGESRDDTDRDEIDEVVDDTNEQEIKHTKATQDQNEIGDYKIENEKRKSKRSGNKSQKDAKSYDYKQIVSVVIHQTDRLLLDSYVVHPVVKVHIVDSNTGGYLKKSNAERNVLFYYENRSIDYVGPIMTESYNLQQHRSMYPNWEESILINDDFNYVTENHTVIFLFEIMDFLSVSLISNYSNNTGSLGWHRIAWAFLRPTGPNFSNVGTKLRLQLYRPRTPLRNCPAQKCDIFHWWSKRKFVKYPSTLYISVKPTAAIDKVVETWRSKTPHEVECGRKPEIHEIPKGVESKTMELIDSSTREWVRLENQICKLPNKCIAQFDSYDDGCFVMKFSSDGRMLACSVLIDNINAIVVYSVLSFELVSKLLGHQGLIYCISWSSDDKILVSASADCTVCVWDAASFKFMQILPHPSFVYTSEIKNNIIVSGCYDNVLRVWWRNDGTDYELQQELKGHDGYITSICFNKDGKLLFSADSIGVVVIWKCMEGQWVMRRKMAILDLKGTAIDQVLLHKRGRRLLINSRDGKIRMVDIKTGYVLQTHNAGINNRVRTTCSLSPCMSYILAGSANGMIHVWNTDTGVVEKVFKPYDLQIPLHCVQYHPKDDYFVISHYGNGLPILLYRHDDEDIGKTILRTSSRRSIVRKENEKNEGGVDFRQILKKMDHVITPSVS